MTNKIQYSKKFPDGSIVVVGGDTVEDFEINYTEFTNSEVVADMFKRILQESKSPAKAEQPHPDPDVQMNQDPSWCPIHETTMKQYNKDGRTWYSHNVDGQWCKGK